MSNRTKLLVDTGIWLRFVLGDSSLPEALRQTLDTALMKGRLYLSALSLSELAMWERQGALTLHQSFEKWAEKAVARSNVQLLPVDQAIACEMEHLPKAQPQWHAYEKAIIATARVNGLALMSERSSFVSYAKTGFIKLG